MPIATPVHLPSAPTRLCSLDNNGLCLDENYDFTAEGITALCEGLEGSAVTSLRCAAALRVFEGVSAR